MKPSGRLSLGLSALVIAAAAADLWVTLRPARAPASRAVLSKAAAQMAAFDGLRVVSPLLSVAEWQGLGELPARPDRPSRRSQASREVIVLDVAAQPVFGLGRPRAVEPLGEGLALNIYPKRPLASAGGGFVLSRDFGPDTMRIEGPSGAVLSRCEAPRGGGGFSCPGQPEWLYAAARSPKVGGSTGRRCLWAHPPSPGRFTVIELPAPPPAPPGMRWRLRLQAALSDTAAAVAGGAAVETEVSQGAQLGRLRAPNRRGWVKRVFDVKAGAPITLRVHTPADGMRHHCLEAELVEVKR